MTSFKGLGFAAAGVALSATGFVSAAQADGEVNIYSYRQPELIQPLLDAFTDQTGITTNIVFASKGLAERMQAEGTNSPADVLLSVDIGRLQGAKDLGVTQAVSNTTIEGNIPPSLRDQEGHWFGLTTRARVIYASKERVKQNSITYEELADPKWKGRLCTRSGQHVYSIGLFASMVAHLGEDKAIQWLESVRDNLARSQPGMTAHRSNQSTLVSAISRLATPTIWARCRPTRKILSRRIGQPLCVFCFRIQKIAAPM